LQPAAAWQIMRRRGCNPGVDVQDDLRRSFAVARALAQLVEP